MRKLFMLPVPARCSQYGAREASTGLYISPTVAISVPIGIASARPVSVSTPVRIVIATAMIEAEHASAGTEPPIAEIPMKIASSEAPMTTPVVRSPKTKPVIAAVTIGRAKVCHDITRSTPLTISHASMTNNAL